MKLVYKRGQWSHWSGYSVFLFRLPFDKFCSCLDKRPLLNPFLVSDRGLPCPVRWIRWLRRAHYFPASPAHPNSSSRSISTSVGGLRKRRHNQHSAQQGKDKWNRHVIQQLSWNCRICGLVGRALASCPVGRGSTWFESRPSRTSVWPRLGNSPMRMKSSSESGRVASCLPLEHLRRHGPCVCHEILLDFLESFGMRKSKETGLFAGLDFHYICSCFSWQLPPVFCGSCQLPPGLLSSESSLSYCELWLLLFLLFSGVSPTCSGNLPQGNSWWILFK